MLRACCSTYPPCSQERRRAPYACSWSAGSIAWTSSVCWRRSGGYVRRAVHDDVDVQTVLRGERGDRLRVAWHAVHERVPGVAKKPSIMGGRAIAKGFDVVDTGPAAGRELGRDGRK